MESDSDSTYPSLEISDEVIGDDGEVESERRLNSIKNIFSLFIRHKWTLKCLEDTAKYINTINSSAYQLPITKYLLLRELMNLSYIRAIQYYCCDACKKYTKCDFYQQKKPDCEHCSTKIKKDDFFVYLSLQQQLEKIIQTHFKEIMQYDNQNGQCRTNANVWTLLMNTDGVSIIKSQTASLWPILLICDFLPPKIRFKDENIIVVSLYHAKGKPDINEFFRLLAEEFSDLSKGVFINGKIFKFFITHASLDLPAKSTVSQIKQYNSYNACNFCMQKGEQTSRGIRYTYTDRIVLRTHANIIADMRKVSRDKGTLNGVK